MHDPVATAARALVARFRRQRPLRSGSLIITMFGDAIAPRGGTATLNSLIRLSRPFGLSERLVRTSVGRLAKDGWLGWRRSGRQSEYFLTEHGRERLTEPTRRIYGALPEEWDGHWTLLILPDTSSSVRERIRRELRWLGFGQLSGGLLAHPNLAPAEARKELTQLGLGAGIVIMRARSEGGESDRRLAATGWDLRELGRAYTRFLAAFTPVHDALAEGGDVTPETAFVIRTLLIHEYRRIHLRDPLLPRALLSDHWVGESAYALCQSLYRRVFEAAETHLSANACTLRGRLAPFSKAAMGRFGGLRAR